MSEIEKVEQPKPKKQAEKVCVYCGDPSKGGSPYVIRKEGKESTVYYLVVDSDKMPKGWITDPYKVK